jgi:CRISPR-associated endonuclease/helicase Cas3
MFSCYKSISSILSETKSVSLFLKDADKYFAHTSKQIGVKPERLAEHFELVQRYFEICSNQNNLDRTIDLLIADLIKKNNIVDEVKTVGDFIKKMFVNVIVYHDYGKVNENFQADKLKMNNPNFVMIANHPLDTHHSALGAYLYITTHLQEIYNELPKSNHLFLSLLILTLSYNIFKHHSRSLSDNISETIFFSAKNIDTMKSYLSKYQFQLNENFSLHVPAKMQTILNQLSTIKGDFTFYAFIKLNFSLLTTSDYLATNEYMNKMVLRDECDFGLITEDMRRKVITNIQRLQTYNEEVYKKYSDTYSFVTPVEQSSKNLNVLRQEMAIKVIQNVRKNLFRNLFYIEAPTGGGKTNLSMIAAVELLAEDRRINKVFYVFPSTTLITQTYTVITDTLGLSPDEITQLHAKAGLQTKEEIEDGEYGDCKKNFIDNIFVNYPFCLLSHIKFFDILKTNEKEANYLLHRLANSIVVIDELQSYNPEHWDKMIFFIVNYASFFNIRFILMSATLPKLGELQVFKDLAPDFVYLLGNDAKEKYFRNPNFKNRVKFKFDLVNNENFNDKNYIDKLDFLADFVISKSKDYAQRDYGKNKPVGSVYSIIEFIFKKSTSTFYEIIKSKQAENIFFDEIFVLSGSILEHRRKEIINLLKSEENRNRRILLIATQVVEAGTDIDMDIGFKDLSLIDSDEQLAGRINRNVNKLQCELYLFKLDEAKRIYGSDERFEFTRDKLHDNIYQEVLETKDFDKLYNLVFSKINKLNNSVMVKNLSDYKAEVKLLNFKKVSDEFKLIDQKNISVFVPLNVPKRIKGKKVDEEEYIFSTYELRFLEENKIDVSKDRISGESIFDLYIRLVRNRNPDFINGRTSIKILQGIMSKFIFSVFKGKDTVAKFTEFSDVDKNGFGFIYLSRWNKEEGNQLYDESFGINEHAFKDSIFI